MISSKMIEHINGDSAIRAMFEEGNKLAALYGRENVFDFSLGNPNFPAPLEVKEATTKVLEEESASINGYMPNLGYPSVRAEISKHLNKIHGTDYTEGNIAMTVGAAGGINILFKTLLNPGDEVIAFAPYFAEYGKYIDNYNGNLVIVPPNTENFQLNLEEFEKMISEKTKVVIINNPNNPSGVIYSEETIKGIGTILDKAEKKYNTHIYLFSDEPYRELVYDGKAVTFIPNYYHNTIIGYSWSKSLSIPGQRIGYLTVPNTVSDFNDVIAGLGIATRILGFVNAPSIAQKMVSKCLNAKTDVAGYDKNRKTLYNGLTEIGYECVKPEGAFYLFVKSPLSDEREFCALAKEYNILLVPGRAFACPGYVRIAYCVSHETIEKALPKFKELMDKINKAD